MDDRDDRNVPQWLCFQSGDGGPFNDVDRCLSCLFLYVMALVGNAVNVIASEACFDRFQVFLCFGHPRVVVHGIPVRAVCLGRYRRIRLFFRGVRVVGIPAGVGRRSPVEVDQFVLCCGAEGYPYGVFRQFFAFGLYERGLRCDLRDVRSAIYELYLGESFAKDGGRLVSLILRAWD